MTTTRTQRTACAVAAVTLLLTGCGAQSDRNAPAAGERETVSSPSAQESGAGASDCPLEPADDVTAEQASHCVYEGWLANNARLIETYGAPDVTHALPFAGDGASFDFQECSPSGESVDPVVCTWTTEAFTTDGVERTFIMRMRAGVESETAGYRVNKIELEPSS